jgi:hypothetical protein
MQTRQNFDDFKKEAERCGDPIAYSFKECCKCLNKATLEILWKDIQPWILSNYVQDEDGQDYEERKWHSSYVYLLRCGECKQLHLISFDWSEEIEDAYENAVDSSISDYEETGCWNKIPVLKAANMKILFPNYMKEIASGEIMDVSTKFVEIYGQAQQAEQIGLNEICGMGYRKAIEMLIIDFILYKDTKTVNPKGLTAECLPKNLGEKITTYFSDMPDFKACAERATWLGNDETHYFKRHSDFNVDDMKKLINILVYGVKMFVLAQYYEGNMHKD